MFGGYQEKLYLCTRFQEAITAPVSNTNQDGDYSSVG